MDINIKILHCKENHYLIKKFGVYIYIYASMTKKQHLLIIEAKYYYNYHIKMKKIKKKPFIPKLIEYYGQGSKNLRIIS